MHVLISLVQTQEAALGPLVLDMLKIPVSHVFFFFLVLCFCQRSAPALYEYCKEVSPCE